MGESFGAICSKCSRKFRVNDGGGQMHELLHCSQCGKEKEIDYLKTGRIPDNQEEAEKIAGSCKCGGPFLVDAPARCPRCKSAEWRKDPEAEEYVYD